MALGRYARIDAQNSSHFCVTVSIVAFVSTCFVGAWLAMSSSIGPLGVGITLQQFTVGMPRKAVLNNTGLHEKLDKHGNENAISLEPQTSEISASHGSESMAGEKAGNPSVSSENEKQNEFSQEKEVALEKNVDSVVETRDGDSKTDLKDGLIEGNEAGNEKAISPGPQTLETMREVGSPSVSENAEVNNLSQEKDGGASPEAETSNREVSTEKNADTVVQTHDGDSKSELKDGRSDANETENDTFSQVAPWPTEAPESEKEKVSVGAPSSLYQSNYSWKVCNVTAGPDYIPCLDNIQAIKTLKSTRHYEHRERHCPDDAPTCLVPLPEGYKTPIKWPKSRDMIWFSNVPHTRLAEYKGGQNWVKVYGRYLAFPGGGTQFVFGALHYIDYLEKSVPDIAWGRRSRVVLDVGCGVASFGGYLFDRDVLTMSLAPKDEHEAQVQFALERGIPAISAVMGTQRLPFPSMVFDVIHCARCRVPWHVEGGKLLLELNRLLRPGGYFIWSATPVYRKDSVDKGIWKDMTELTESICWELVKVERDSVNRKAAAIYRKPVTNNCYEGRLKNDPPLCEESDDSSKAWYTPLQSCIHKVPSDPSKRGSHWPPQWPSRLIETPYWLKGYDVSRDITDDYNHWKHVVINMYSNESGIDWSSVRNVMDMSASYGGFAAALKDFKAWVMNVVPVNSSDTLPIIYERGLFGIYHDWCESFSTYPRSYDLLHANHLFSDLKKRCTLIAIMAEVDRILRPGGFLIVIDDTETVSEMESMAHSLQWKIKFTYSKDNNVTICVEKTMWRPSETETILSAIG